MIIPLGNEVKLTNIKIILFISYLFIKIEPSDDRFIRIKILRSSLYVMRLKITLYSLIYYYYHIIIIILFYYYHIILLLSYYFIILLLLKN